MLATHEAPRTTQRQDPTLGALLETVAYGFLLALLLLLEGFARLLSGVFQCPGCAG